MNENNNTTNVEGLEITVTKATELNKTDFFKMLAGAEEGLTLTIDRVGNVFKSKYSNDNGIKPSGIFIDYSFTKDSKPYEIGIYYNLGVASENKFKLSSNMNVFKILAVAVDLSEADEIKVTEEFIQKTLTGITFKAEVGTSYNGGFLIEPVVLFETAEGIVDPINKL